MKDGDRDRDRDRDRDALFQICLLEGFMQNGKSFHVEGLYVKEQRRFRWLTCEDSVRAL